MDRGPQGLGLGSVIGLAVVVAVVTAVIASLVTAQLVDDDPSPDEIVDEVAGELRSELREFVVERVDDAVPTTTSTPRRELEDLGASPGSGLESLSDEPLPVEQATLTVHSDGCGVIRSEFEETPGNLTWSVRDSEGFQVLGRNAEGETRYRYFQSGTYTVVLEAWNGDFYAPVSNEVTINC